MAALRSFDIIQGQAAPRAITLRAIVQSFGHEIVMDESTSTRCIIRGRRRGASEWQRSVWTIDRAKDLGLTGKDGWKKQPTAMLVARATSEICRLVAADAILGIGYTTEELTDGATGEPAAVEEYVATEPTPAQPATRRMSRKAPAAPAETEPTEAATETTGEAITDHTRRKMFALLNDVGESDPDKQRAGMSRILGREVTSRGDLTEAEAQQVCDSLRAFITSRDADAVQRGEA